MIVRTRRTPLAWRNITEQRLKTLTAVAGLGFAITLILMQIGFLEAVRVTATNVYDQLQFDLVVLSRKYQQFYDASDIDMSRLHQALSQPGVRKADPLFVGMNLWRSPPAREREPAFFRAACVLGIDLERDPFGPPIREQIDATLPELQQRHTVLLDVRSHPDFGWSRRDQTHTWELGRQRVDIVGGFTLGAGFAADGTVLCSDENFVRFFPWRNVLRPSIGLLVLDRSARPAVVAEKLARVLPPDVEVLTREEIEDREIEYWVYNTATGTLFGFGVFVALCVGTVVIYQVLSNDIANRFKEYATLKAMGYRNWYLSGVVISQAVIYAVISYVPAVIASFILYRVTAALANIPMRLTAFNLLFVFVATLVMCLLSAVLTVRKVHAADPAELF